MDKARLWPAASRQPWLSALTSTCANYFIPLGFFVLYMWSTPASWL
jgi:hypothetical protein